MTGSTSERDESASSEPYARVPRVGISNVIRLLEEAQRSGSAPTIVQVANAVGQSLNSGAFRMRTAAAALYGAVEPERGRLKITDRGHKLIDSDTRRAAAVEAFFSIEVFERFYRTYEGVNLPAASGIEAELASCNVNPRLLADARRVMTSSAELAGLYEVNPRRLTRPAIDAPTRTEQPVFETVATAPPTLRPEKDAGPGTGPAVSPVHALIGGLVSQLPTPGEDVDPRGLQRWLDAVKGNLEWFYQVDLVGPE